MVKLILLPKFDQQCAKRIARDSVARGLLPMAGVVRAAMCQDGRMPGCRGTLEAESEYFSKLYNDWDYLNMPGTCVQRYAFSFGDPPDTLRGHLRELASTDIFYMTGFSPGHGMSPMLEAVFRDHDRFGLDESDGSSLVESLFRAIKTRVQYNQMLYIGTCGGAISAGQRYLPTRLPLFDFCMGVSLRYDFGKSPDNCDSGAISANTFIMTSGAAVAVHINSDTALASSFPSGKGAKWVDWRKGASARLQEAVQHIAAQNVSGPYYWPGVGTWWCRVTGVAVQFALAAAAPEAGSASAS